MATRESARSTMIGVFEVQAQAEQAVHELRSAGFSDDQVKLVVHRAPGMGEEIIGDERRIEAGESGTIEAPGILLRNGANNADIPEALAAELAPIVGPEAAGPARQAEQPIDARSRDSFFEAPGPGSPGDPETPLDVGVWDNPPTQDDPPRHPRP